MSKVLEIDYVPKTCAHPEAVLEGAFKEAASQYAADHGYADFVLFSSADMSRICSIAGCFYDSMFREALAAKGFDDLDVRGLAIGSIDEILDLIKEISGHSHDHILGGTGDNVLYGIMKPRYHCF